MLQSAIVYIRVSTEGQAIDGVSLDAQRAKIEAWCLANDYKVVDSFVDAGLSGSRADNRPGLQNAIYSACQNKAALVVYSLSRLARSTQDTIAIGEKLAKAGADLVSLSEKIDTTSAAGKMVFRMLAVLAEFERDQISERTRMALAHKRNRGERIGTVPYGWCLAEDGSTLLPDAGQQAVIQRIRNMRSEGMSYRAIAVALEALQVKTKAGNAKWTHTSVKSISSRNCASPPHVTVNDHSPIATA